MQMLEKLFEKQISHSRKPWVQKPPVNHGAETGLSPKAAHFHHSEEKDGALPI
jgi:hypothetical protein